MQCLGLDTLLITAIYCLIQRRKSKGCEIIWKHIRGMGGYHTSRRYLAVNTARLLLENGGGVFSASRQAKEMPSCRQAACLFTQHKPTQDLHRSKLQTPRQMQITWWVMQREPLQTLWVASAWQDEVCNTMKLIMHLRHVSLSRGMGAER